MIDETYVVVLLVLLMLVGSYIVGSIPLIMKLSEEKLKLITVLGAGLLVGTALTVIIPEGVRSLHASQKGADLPSLAIYKYAITNAPLEKINDYSQTIGISLVLGFVFMMLIDQFSQKRQNSTAISDKAITATLGLVVHAAADGVALGAVATTSHHDVEIIVFFAIMLHKAPAAFGLVSFLLHEKTERQKIRKHLIIFSISAPLFTLVTYFCIGQEHKETLNSVNATGITMLFSAGTFLYVATVHVLPQLIQNGIEHKQQEQTYGEQSYHLYENVYTTVEMQTSIISPSKSTGLHCCELVIMICGTMLPLVITLCHKH